MRVILWSVSHHTAPVEVREKISLSGDRLEQAVHAFRQQFPMAECVLLSTCNRTELYFSRLSHEKPGIDDVHQFFSSVTGVDPASLTSVAVHREHDQAINHLFRVATGLESMVLGEPQVLGQIKRAYEVASEAGAVGPTLHRVFQQAIAVSRRARQETGVDQGRLSIGSVAVEFAQRIFDSFSDKVVLGIGAGEMAKLTLRHLRALNPARLWIVNRTTERAVALADKLGVLPPTGGVQPFENLDELLVEADIVLTSTGAREPILTVERFKPILRRRRHRPLFIIDIAVPRNVEPAVASLANVYVYDIDDLRTVVSKNAQSRQAQVDACQSIINRAVKETLVQVQARAMGQLVKALRHRFEGIASAETQRTAHKLQAIATPQQQEAIEQLLHEHTHRVLNKLLHLPTHYLTTQSPETPMGFYAGALRRLFDLAELEALVENPPPKSVDQKADPPHPSNAASPGDSPQS